MKNYNKLTNISAQDLLWQYKYDVLISISLVDVQWQQYNMLQLVLGDYKDLIFFLPMFNINSS